MILKGFHYEIDNPLFGISGFKHFTLLSSFKQNFDSFDVVYWSLFHQKREYDCQKS